VLFVWIWAHLESLLGAALVLTVLLDVFLTILYARIGAYVFSLPLARLTWKLLRLASKAFGARRGIVLSFCGPVILVSLIVVWALVLICGTAMIIEPLLGTSVQRAHVHEHYDFVTAMYVAGSSLAIVGQNEFAPQTGGTRMLYLFDSFVGISTMSLTLTYLMQVYSALRERNAFGMKVHLLSDETGDAAELIARLGQDGELAIGCTQFSELAMDVTNVNVSHHFYPVLFFFRFPEPDYSVSRFSLLALDAVTLIESALDREIFAALRTSGAVAHLWRASLGLVTTLEDAFLPGGAADSDDSVPPEAGERWRRRYFAALPRLRQAGIQTTQNERAGAEMYIRLRSSWDRHIAKLVPHMGYEMAEIDPSGCGRDVPTHPLWGHARHARHAR
jgi:hypothetical protein